MSIRKRSWSTPTGEQKSAWLVDYRDNGGARRSKQFPRKKDAEAWLTQVAWQLTQGTHTPDSQSITISKAGDLWIAEAYRNKLEATTIASYEQHLRLHIRPLCGDRKLSQLTKPIMRGFRNDLVEKLSRPMAARVMRSLTSIIAEAEGLGYVAHNVALGVTVKQPDRDKEKPLVPTKSEMRAMIEAARASDNPMDAPLVLTCVFTGLRASELRGLTWTHVNLKTRTLTVAQRADAHNVLGRPKSEMGRRTIPLAESLVSELRTWKLRCPKTELELVFPSPGREIISHRSLHRLHLWPVQCVAKVAIEVEGEDGEKQLRARYSTHALRHCAASLWIEQRVAPKRIQSWMGHSSIKVTFDVYGHLFEQSEADAGVMAAVEKEVFGAGNAA